MLFKRLNVISAFETAVDKALVDDDHHLQFSGYMKNDMQRYGYVNSVHCIAIKKPVDLNEKEALYITKHFNMRKTYKSAFIKVSDLANGKHTGKLSSFAKAVRTSLIQTNEINEDDVYFLILRNRF